MKYLSVILSGAVLWTGAVSPFSASAQTAHPVRSASEDVNDPAVRLRPGLQPDKAMLFNGWGITPAGESVVTTDLPLKFVIAPDHKFMLAVHGGFNQHGVDIIDLATRKSVQFLPLDFAWNGLAFSADGKQFFVSGGSSGVLHVFNYADGQGTFVRSITPNLDRNADQLFLSGIAVDPHTGNVYVCNEANDEVLVFDGKSFAVETAIPAGSHPHSCVIGGDGAHLYVSNWGGRSVSIVDMKAARRLREVEVGIHPNDMALAPDGRLFVACAGDNSVSVIATGHLESEDAAPDRTRLLPTGSREIISTSLYPQSPEGSTPDALAVSPDGHTLFVANADNNDVVVVDISNALADDKARDNHESVSFVQGFIPVGWYPSAIAVSPDGKTLLVGNGKGMSSRANYPPLEDAKPSNLHARRAKKAGFDYIGNTLTGTISFINLPDAPKLADYTRQVRLNSPYKPADFQTAPVAASSVIPAKVGDACPIRYVLYIIKENRTYDQVLGDFRDQNGQPAGNGNSNITMYGESVTPNHHQLARDYVLLDNLYCNGEVSADGHSWCDAAIANDFNERNWLLSYSRHGNLSGNEEMEIPTSGYLWDLCRRHGVSFKNYGEGTVRVPTANRGTWHGTAFKDRDMNRVDGWIQDLHTAETNGELPHFMIMSLGEDHTEGTKAGTFTPDAHVASNDIGLGKIVAAASRSRFWKEMAIFVIEDDAQNGPDHVDAHRTVGLVISPYCKRGIVDNTLYTTASMVRTMELILGLPPLTQYDAAATPMFNSFGQTPEITHYNPLTPKVDLYAKNTKKSPGAAESGRMDFHDYDFAPEDQLNRVLWADAKGVNTPYPTPIHRALFLAQTEPAVRKD